MSFQEKAESVRSCLHFGDVKPGYLVFGLVAGAVALTCAAYTLVGMVSAHSFEVRKADEASEVEDAEIESGEDVELESGEAERLSVVVHVAGSVSKPGLYTLEEGQRVGDAVEIAGGFTGDANSSAVNLARVLVDGEQVWVPSVREASESNSSASENAGPSSAANSALININTATVEELTQLNGVGTATAEKIIAERTQNGSFASIEDIMRVSGIGEKRFEAIKKFICV